MVINIKSVVYPAVLYWIKAVQYKDRDRETKMK